MKRKIRSICHHINVALHKQVIHFPSSSEEHSLHDDLWCLCYSDMPGFVNPVCSICGERTSASAGRDLCFLGMWWTFWLIEKFTVPPFFSRKEFVNFFLLHYKKEVSVSDRMEFVNGWYIMIIISDILTITGSILKMEIQAKVKFFPIYVIVSIRFAWTIIYFFQNVKNSQSKLFLSNILLSKPEITVTCKNLVQKSFRLSFPKCDSQSSASGSFG